MLAPAAIWGSCASLLLFCQYHDQAHSTGEHSAATAFSARPVGFTISCSRRTSHSELLLLWMQHESKPEDQLLSRFLSLVSCNCIWGTEHTPSCMLSFLTQRKPIFQDLIPVQVASGSQQSSSLRLRVFLPGGRAPVGSASQQLCCACTDSAC